MARGQSLYDWCLENGEWGQQLLFEFGDGNNSQQFTNEFGIAMTPHDFTKASGKKIKWTCLNKHEWFATITNRVLNKSKCPYCSGKKTSANNSIINWCQSNGEFGQQLINEWTGICDDGNHYEMTEISKGSNKKMLWKCSKGHEWYAMIANRIFHKQGCPYCSGRITSEDNNLLTWCQSNGDFGQQLIDEWTGICDDDNHYEMTEVTKATHKKMLWKCSKGHEWYSEISNRTRIGMNVGCPYCAGNRVSDENSLLIWCRNNGYHGQQLIKEWTGQSEEGQKYEMYNISFGSNTRMLWRCSKGHEWVTAVTHRTGRKTGCPYCAGIYVSEENNLYAWCKHNKEYGDTLVNEWVGKDDNEIEIDIKSIAYGTKKKVQWKCAKGHIFIASPLARTGRNHTGCPICSARSTSYPEQFLYWSLKQIYDDTESRCRVLKTEENPQGIEFDIAIPIEIDGYNAVCIEYSPTHWHSDKSDRDQLKADICKQYNIRFIYIKEDSYNEYEEIWDTDYICFHMENTKRDEYCKKIVDHILKTLGHSISELNIELVKKNAIEYSRGKIEYEKSMKYTYPELAKEWHETLNNSTPDQYSATSSFMAYWKCTKCNYGNCGEWQITIANRTVHKSGCPQCGYNWYKAQTGQPQKIKFPYSLNIF